MKHYPVILVDTGLLVAFYDSADRHHAQVVEFFANCIRLSSFSFANQGKCGPVPWIGISFHGGEHRLPQCLGFVRGFL